MIRSFSFTTNRSVRTSGSTIEFGSSIAGPASLASDISYNVESLQSTERLKFSVALPVKPVRTAIGFTFGPDRETRYLTPDYVSHSNYISMGGAGFIYPFKKSAKKGYGEGDTIACILSKASREAKIEFCVNEVTVYTMTVPASFDLTAIYPTISVQGGGVKAVVDLSII